MKVMVQYQRTIICAYVLTNGWVAKYVIDYMGPDHAWQYGKVLPFKMAKEMFPGIPGKYNPSV